MNTIEFGKVMEVIAEALRRVEAGIVTAEGAADSVRQRINKLLGGITPA